ncbi:MAG: hypothetical protein FWC79_03405 [Oscillospiraceae bacterium]|nr:hypothetical protein [Oscillospiraceae bacterium]
MHDGNITDNTSGYGGGVLVEGPDSSFTMHGGNIIENVSTRGGGVSIDGTFTMNGGRINENIAFWNATSNQTPGGGVYVTGGEFIMNGGEIAYNTAGGTSGGGGVFAHLIDATFTMNGGEIRGNTAGGSSGGVWGHLEMHDGQITGNTAGNSGGGVGGHLTMYGGEITGNTATNRGGGVFTASASGVSTIHGGKIADNTSNNGGGVALQTPFAIYGGEIIDNVAKNNGGGVYAPHGFFTMNDGTIEGNTAENNGGGVYGRFTMNDGEIANNTAESSGGGVHGTMTMYGGKITGNTAAINGGGIFSPGVVGHMPNAGIIIHEGEITDNTAGMNGGGIYTSDTVLTMNDGKIIGNIAGVSGGGVKILSNTTNDCWWCCNRNDFTGAGIFTMNGGEISGNITEVHGGGVYVAGSNFTITGGEIDNNIAGIYGGGVKLTEGNNILGDFWCADCCFSCCCWSGFNPIPQASISMSNVAIRNNIANSGGGLFVPHNNTFIWNISSIANSTVFTGNVARNGLFINDAVNALNPQINPGTISVLGTHALTNYDINVGASGSTQAILLTFAVRNGEGGTLEAAGNTVTGTQIGQVLVNDGDETRLTAAPDTDWEVVGWYINNVRQTGNISNILDYISTAPGPSHIEILFGEEELLFNLALRTFISQIETNGAINNTNRAPIVSMPSVFAGELIYTFPVDKSVNPVQMTNGSIMTQTIRIFNEGTIAGYVNEIANDIPAGLEFLPNHSTNLNYEWVMYDVSGQVTTDASEAVEIRTRYLEDNRIEAFDPDLGVIAGNPDYRDIQVAFRVTYEGGTGRIIVSRSEIYDAEAFGGGTIGYINLLDEEQDTEYMYVVRTDVGNNNNNEDDGEVKGEYRPGQGTGNAVSTNDPISNVRYIVLIVIAMVGMVIILREKKN